MVNERKYAEKLKTFVTEKLGLGQNRDMAAVRQLEWRGPHIEVGRHVDFVTEVTEDGIDTREAGFMTYADLAANRYTITVF